MRAIAPIAVVLALVLAGCFQEPDAVATGPAATIPVTDLSSIEPPASAEPSATRDATSPPTQGPTPSDAAPTASPSATFAEGPPSDDCRDGWIRPAPGSAEYDHALAVLSAQMGVSGSWTVEDMRYFTGPEVPFSEPEYEPVERWYVKASLTDDPTFQARWLIERRTDVIQGISAVASHDSTGFASPDWTAFVGEGEPVSYLGLPGQWSGIPYDFVTGEGDSGNPGLPDEVVGCLSGT